jgi:hypothetical protein
VNYDERARVPDAAFFLLPFAVPLAPTCFGLAAAFFGIEAPFVVAAFLATAFFTLTAPFAGAFPVALVRAFFIPFAVGAAVDDLGLTARLGAEDFSVASVGRGGAVVGSGIAGLSRWSPKYSIIGMK